MMKNKVVWLTGASDGIGAALIPLLKMEQVLIVVSSRNEDKLSTLLSQNGYDDSNSLSLPFDLLNVEIGTQTAKVLKKFGRIDIVILCAGLNQKSYAFDTDSEVEKAIFQVNYFANIDIVKAVLPSMMAQKSGQIVAVSSIIAKFGAPFLSTYSASKHALEGYLESLRYEVEAHNIHISVVCPGFVATNIDLKALTKDGSAYSIKSEAQAKGIAPSKVGNAVIKSIKSQKRYKYVGKLEILMPYLNFLLPKTFYFILKKLHKL